MSFSVVILSKNAANLEACVWAKIEREGPCGLIVVDDGLDRIPECCDGGEIVPGVKPFIFARNANIGIKAADTDDVILLNDDALLQTRDGFAKLRAFADAHPEVGCVAPSCNITGQRLQWPHYRTPQGWRYVDQVPYICVYIPRRTLDQVGLLDERYCLDYGCEDLDHTEAMKRAGLKVAVLYDVFVDHGSLHSSYRGDPKAHRSFARNYALFRKKWGK